jgi:hypothetical protein
MTAYCKECQPYLTESEMYDAEMIDDFEQADHCVGCDFVLIKIEIDKENNLLN